MVENQRDLEKLIKMLRKNGVEAAKIDGIELKLSPNFEEQPSKYMQKKRGPVQKDDSLPPENPPYTEEQILMWSSTPPGGEPSGEA